VEKLMVELSARFAERPGGYTRIIKLGRRRGDGAAMSIIEFVDAPPPVVEDAIDGDADASDVVEAPSGGAASKDDGDAAVDG